MPVQSFCTKFCTKQCLSLSGTKMSGHIFFCQFTHYICSHKLSLLNIDCKCWQKVLFLLKDEIVVTRTYSGENVWMNLHVYQQYLTIIVKTWSFTLKCHIYCYSRIFNQLMLHHIHQSLLIFILSERRIPLKGFQGKRKDLEDNIVNYVR